MTPANANIGASGGSATFTVSNTQGSNCTWTASSSAGFFTITSGASGTGNGTVTVSAASNSGLARSGTLSIAGQTIAMTQDGAPLSCTYSVTPTSRQVGYAGGITTFAVATTQGTGCAWTAVANAGFLSIAAGSPGTGNGTVTASVASNSGSARSGTLTIAGQTVTVAQDGVPCAISATPTQVTVPRAGGTATFSVAVTQGSNCRWTAISASTPHVTVTSGSSGTGPGTVTVAVLPWTGHGVRTEGIWIAGVNEDRPKSYFIHQPAVSCTGSEHTVTPSAVNVPASGGTVTFTLTYPEGASCRWTIGNPGSWATVTSPSSLTGVNSATITVGVAANTGAARTVTFGIAGKAVSITQSAAP